MRLLLLLLALLFISNNSFSQAINSPEISVESGFYTEVFTVEITHEDEDVQILYTLDGSVPTIENLDSKKWNYKINYQRNSTDIDGELLQDSIKTFEYASPINIEDKEGTPDRYADISASHIMNEEYYNAMKPHLHHVFKGTNLRVVAYKNGEYSKVVTRNYFISPEGDNRYSLPIICISVDPEEFFGYEDGIYVPGLLFDEWREDNPNKDMPIGSDNWRFAPGNYREKGEETEKEINFSYYENGKEVLNHGAGIRINGNTSRLFSNRALRLYARNDYGTKNFKHEFFTDYPLNKFKRLILRNSGSDTRLTMLRDAYAHEVVKNTNCITQQYQPVIVFINGEYWGLYNLRERYDKKYFKNKFDIEEDDLDYIKETTPKEGDTEKYEDLYDFLSQNSLEDEENLEEFLKMVDPENLVDYIIAETFYSNIDWPTNNNEYFRKRIEFDSDNTNEDDGRFRWVIKDLDVGLGDRWDHEGYQFDDISEFLDVNPNEDYWTSAIKQPYRSLMENESYKLYFINRYCDLLNTTFEENRLSSLFEYYSGVIEPEMNEFIERWTPGQEGMFGNSYIVSSYNKWQDNLAVVENFIENRQDVIREHIRNRFETGNGEFNLTFNVSNEEHGYIRINTIDIIEDTDGIEETVYPWSGIYLNGVPQTISAIPREGYQFSHWSGDINTIDSSFTLSFDNDANLKAHFVPEGSLDIKENEIDNIHLYPNPTKDIVNIITANNEDIIISDVIGKVIEKLNLKQGLNTIDFSAYNNGIFFIKFSESGVTKRIVKE